MKRFYEYAGIAASIVLVAFGIGAVVMGISGRDTVRNELSREQIVGTPDMTKSVANKHITTGSMARDFARGMRKHALEATGGMTYAQMPRYMGKNGKPTNDQAAAAVDPKSGAPVDNPARNIWVTETALSTALNTSYFAENVANFAIIMGIALLLTGGGFGVVSLRVLHVATEEKKKAREPKPVKGSAVTA